jgi:hypothetical protein
MTSTSVPSITKIHALQERRGQTFLKEKERENNVPVWETSAMDVTDSPRKDCKRERRTSKSGDEFGVKRGKRRTSSESTCKGGACAREGGRVSMAARGGRKGGKDEPPKNTATRK